MRISMICSWYKKILAGMLLMAISLCISGCWDRKELDERNFVLAVAIDKADQEKDKVGSGVERLMQPYGNKRYRLSLQIMDVIPSQNNMMGGSQGEIATYIVSNTGESLLEMVRDMLGQVARGFWFEHVQAIVISEAVVREGGLQPIIDFFRRDREMRWLTKILITSGEAHRFLEYQPPGGEASGIFMVNSLRLYGKNPHVAGWHTDVGNLTQAVDNKSRVLISRIEIFDNVVKLGGMAFFTGGKFGGYIDEYAVKGGKFLNGIEKSAIITIECPEHPGKMIAFELFHNDTKLRPYVKNGKIYFTLTISMNGNLSEVQCDQLHDAMEVQEIHKIERWIAEEVKNNALYAFHTYQRLQVDADGLGPKLKAYEPVVWENVKEDWDEKTFPTISLDVSVRVKIENIGEHR